MTPEELAKWKAEVDRENALAAQSGKPAEPNPSAAPMLRGTTSSDAGLLATNALLGGAAPEVLPFTQKVDQLLIDKPTNFMRQMVGADKLPRRPDITGQDVDLAIDAAKERGGVARGTAEIGGGLAGTYIASKAMLPFQFARGASKVAQLSRMGGGAALQAAGGEAAQQASGAETFNPLTPLMVGGSAALMELAGDPIGRVLGRTLMPVATKLEGIKNEVGKYANPIIEEILGFAKNQGLLGKNALPTGEAVVAAGEKTLDPALKQAGQKIGTQAADLAVASGEELAAKNAAEMRKIILGQRQAATKGELSNISLAEKARLKEIKDAADAQFKGISGAEKASIGDINTQLKSTIDPLAKAAKPSEMAAAKKALTATDTKTMDDITGQFQGLQPQGLLEASKPIMNMRGIDPMVETVRKEIGGNFTGESYNAVRKELAQRFANAATPNEAAAIRTAIDSLDTVIGREAPTLGSINKLESEALDVERATAEGLNEIRDRPSALLSGKTQAEAAAQAERQAVQGAAQGQRTAVQGATQAERDAAAKLYGGQRVGPTKQAAEQAALKPAITASSSKAFKPTPPPPGNKIMDALTKAAPYVLGTLGAGGGVATLGVPGLLAAGAAGLPWAYRGAKRIDKGLGAKGALDLINTDPVMALQLMGKTNEGAEMLRQSGGWLLPQILQNDFTRALVRPIEGMFSPSTEKKETSAERADRRQKGRDRR